MEYGTSSIALMTDDLVKERAGLTQWRWEVVELDVCLEKFPTRAANFAIKQIMFCLYGGLRNSLGTHFGPVEFISNARAMRYKLNNVFLLKRILFELSLLLEDD